MSIMAFFLKKITNHWTIKNNFHVLIQTIFFLQFKFQFPSAFFHDLQFFTSLSETPTWNLFFDFHPTRLKLNCALNNCLNWKYILINAAFFSTTLSIFIFES